MTRQSLVTATDRGPESAPMIELDNAQRRALRKVLASAFDRRALERLAGDFLPERYDNLVRSGRLEDEAFDLIEACRQRGWLDRLVRGVIADRPAATTGISDFLAFQDDLGTSSTDARSGALEKLVGKNRLFLDVESWRTKLAEFEWRVCQVRRDDDAIGTGFLVAADLVLTNHHVMEGAISSGSAKGYSFAFDYRRTRKGKTLHAGTPVAPAREWLVAASPPSVADLEADPKSCAPQEDELDFAFVRLVAPVGESAPFQSSSGEPRGWIPIPDDEYAFESRPGLAILQHPRGEPLKLSLDPGCKGHRDRSGLRVRYDLPTLAGSSGSPVLDAETFRLVALHHAGDPAYAAKYNQAIPISRIAAHPSVRKLGL